ncbi:MAG: MinD/ParA family protein [Candidatus Anstonellaceae archaeon]
MKHMISFVSGKGGVGKTTIATNLAIYAALAKNQCLIADLDFYNPSVAFHLGLTHSYVGLSSFLKNKATLEESLIIHPPTGLRCLFPSITEDGLSKKLKLPSLSKLFRVLHSQSYNCCFLDCPPGLPREVREALEASNIVVVVMTPDIPSVSAALKIASIIKKLKVKDQQILYVLNRVSGQSYELKTPEIEQILEDKIIAQIPEDQNIPRAIAEKMPVLLAYPNSKSSVQLKKFAAKIGGCKLQGNLFSFKRPDFRSIFDKIFKYIGF